MKFSATLLFRKNLEVDKPYEDWAIIDEAHGVFCVADGVTRIRNQNQIYPTPSPATEAAKIASREIVDFIAAHSVYSESDALLILKEAFLTANMKIKDYASTLPAADFLWNDLPGCVATTVVLRNNRAIYAHLGDTVLAHIQDGLEFAKLTTDQTKSVLLWASQNKSMNTLERLAAIRKSFRNRLGTAESYGVLTGEEEAISFIEYGSRQLAVGDRLLLFTDGLSRWFEFCCATADGRAFIVAELKKNTLENILIAAEELDKSLKIPSDDKTLISIELLDLA